MTKLSFGLFAFIPLITISAQNVQWQKDIKTSTQDFLNKVSVTLDGQYLISGSSIQSSKLTSVSTSGAGQQNSGFDYHLVKLNQSGEEVWEKFFSGQNHDMLTATVATQEGGFLIAGSSYSPKGGDKKEEGKGGSDIWLLKLSENGEEEWQKTLGTEKDDEAAGVIQTTDLGYVVAGNSQNPTGGFGSKDVWVVSLDRDGKQLSQTVLGGKGLDEVRKISPTRDGGFILGIYSRSAATSADKAASGKKDGKDGAPKVQYISKSTGNYGEGDYWIVKFNREGKMDWQRSFGGKEDDNIRTLSLTIDGYIIGGESRSERSGNKSVGIQEGTDLWLVALNEKGEERWQKGYSLKNRDVLMSSNVIYNGDDTQSKGILLGGFTQAEGRIEKDDETFWMMYLDMDGNEKWRKHIKGESRQKEERLADLKMNRDGSIILAGTSAPELGRENWKIVKLGDKLVDDVIEKLDIKIYPNPVDDYCYVEIGFAFKEATLEVYDMAGRMLQTLKTKTPVTKINTQNLIQGAYVIIAKTESKSANAKLIKK